MSDRRVRRALVSVFDKEGLVPFCERLARLGIEILSSGGTASRLAEAGLTVRSVSDVTGFPEMLGGRVKTLHPKIHGGILGVRDNDTHREEMSTHGIEPIDLVVVNLYPFVDTISTPGVTRAEAVEMIDIGGPTLIRSAAKNHADVAVLVDPEDYDTVAATLESTGSIDERRRRSLAAKAFRHTAEYDTAITRYLGADGAPEETGAALFPERYTYDWVKVQDLRYGENPHQAAAFYRDPTDAEPSVASAKQLQGKELSFNNILDFDAALQLALEFDECVCVIVKHGNPCGVAVGDDSAEAFQRALETDPTSAFGGVIACNRPIEQAAGDAIGEAFYEGVIAPGFDEAARARLAKKKNLRLLELPLASAPRRSGADLRRVGGGILVQDWDPRLGASVQEAKVVTRRPPTEAEWKALAFNWRVCKHVKSNAIVYGRENRTVGIGAGQMSRVDSARIAVDKARSPLEGCVGASDAFFPFRDGLDAAAEHGIVAMIQPGGSKRDGEVIAAADEHGLAMVFTGRRHFRH